MPPTFQSPEVADLWRLIDSSVARLVELTGDFEASGGSAALRWRPPVADANSVIALAHHTLENLEDNLVYTAPGRDRDRPREREAEFDADDDSSARLVARWADLRPRAEAALASLPTAVLGERRVHPRRGEQSVLTVLVVVARHCAEHLAHAELTRDLHAAQLGASD
jgi:hypothetical protein